MEASSDRQLSFEPRTRADSRRRLTLGMLSALLWLVGLAAVAVVIARNDVLITALLFTAACFGLALLLLTGASVARRRREAAAKRR